MALGAWIRRRRCDLVALPISRDQVTAGFSSWPTEIMATAERHHHISRKEWRSAERAPITLRKQFASAAGMTQSPAAWFQRPRSGKDARRDQGQDARALSRESWRKGTRSGPAPLHPMTHLQHFSVQSSPPSLAGKKLSICFDSLAEAKWRQVGLMEKARAYCFHECFGKAL
jgi:hypothetical protein